MTEDAKLIERLRYASWNSDDFAICDEAADRLAVLSAALADIAKQQTTYELESDDGDFEEGYDAIIKIARDALSSEIK